MKILKEYFANIKKAIRNIIRVIYIILISLFTQPLPLTWALVKGMWSGFKSKWEYSNYMGFIMDVIALLIFIINSVFYAGKNPTLLTVAWTFLIIGFVFQFLSDRIDKKQLRNN